MPKRTDIKSIAIIGAGPIIIGQACEFDYSGTQACKALREEGYRIVLINSNPATIMTDPEMADATYIEPITPGVVAKILEQERPDALLPTMGGQTALNTALALAEDGTLERLGIELIGANREAIEMAEDRNKFKECMNRLGLESARSKTIHSIDEAEAALEYVGLPAIIRPSFTLGGTGGGIAYNKEEYEEIVYSGLDASPTTEVLIEESLLGWKEYEMEVVRDKNDNCIIVCSIENVDPMGVHTGDSITVAPAMTLTDKEYQIMRNASIATLRGIGVETGGSNVQFAINPADGRMIVIEMNPRVSRSSALASKATGFPIAKIAAKLAVGYTLDELKNDITGGRTPASFEPTIDYVVTKVPRFAFEKFKGAKPLLNTSMKSVGEVMAIGRSFEESLQKSMRSLEKGLTGLDPMPIPNADPTRIRNHRCDTGRRCAADAAAYSSYRDAIRHGISLERIHDTCKYDPWFLERIKNIVDAEKGITAKGLPVDREGWVRLKKLGFSDARLAIVMNVTEAQVRKARKTHNVHPVFKRVDTCAAEIPSSTPYMYSCYEGDGINEPESEIDPSDKEKSSSSAAGRTGSARGSNSIIAACMQVMRCARRVMKRSWSTATRKRFRRITIRRTGFISSR
jgi:carbamoyl-phosphate synthase large subunit